MNSSYKEEIKGDLNDENKNHCMKALTFKAKDLTAGGTQ